MIKVHLKKTWFGPFPERSVAKDVLVVGGARYRAGIYDFPDEWRVLLPAPPVAVILSDDADVEALPIPGEVPAGENTLRDFDIARAASDALMDLGNEQAEAAAAAEAAVEAARQQKIRDRMAKARAARGSKSKEK